MGIINKNRKLRDLEDILNGTFKEIIPEDRELALRNTIALERIADATEKLASTVGGDRPNRVIKTIQKRPHINDRF